MLRLTSGSERLVPDNCIQFTDTKVIENNLDAYNIYITTDYTTTSGEKSDFSGIATWAVNSNEDWFMLNLYLRKMGMDTQYALTLEEADKYKRKGKNVQIGVEVDGNQSAHVNALEKEMRNTGTYHPFAKQKGQLDNPRKGILSKSTGMAKHERFRIAASQVFLPGKVWLPKHLERTPDMQEFISQIKGATHEAFTRADDGCFTGDTLIEMADGTQKEIKDIKNGDIVITSSSTSAIAKASDAIITGVKEVEDYYLSDGTRISMTDNHPVYTTKGWVYAEDLTSEHKIIKARKCINKLRDLGINGLKKVQDTTNQHKRSKVKEDGYTNGYGNVQMGLNQKDMKYITKIITNITMNSVTWNFSLPKNMQSIIEKMHGCLEMRKIERKTLNNLIVLDILLQNGIVQMKAENGIKNIEHLWEMLHLLRINSGSVLGVVMNSCIGSQLEMHTALIAAFIKPTKKGIKIQLKKSVKYAEKNSQLTEQTEQELAVRPVQMNLIDKLLTIVKLPKLVKFAKARMKEQKDQSTAQRTVRNLQQTSDVEKVNHLKVEPALSVESYLKAVTQELSTVGRTVEAVTIIGKSGKRKEIVYNFAVKGTETYLVNGGVVVHNCDLVTQAVVSMHVYYPTYEAANTKITPDGVHYYQGSIKPTNAYSNY